MDEGTAGGTTAAVPLHFMSLHRFSVATAVLTFAQLILGGLVHNTRSSLACPDWPLCHGKVFPHMVGGVLVEHSHRLVGTSVGMMTIGLLIWLWIEGRRRRDPGLKQLGVAVLALVCIQGLLGGLTVIYRLPPAVSTTHLAVSMIFFSLVIYIAFRTRPRRSEPRAPLSRSVRIVTAIATLTLFTQMVLGALMRHLGAGLACMDLPLCRGSLWPAGANGYLLVHMAHRTLAVITFLVVLGATIVTYRNARGRRGVQTLAILAPIGILGQITLGVLSITTFLDVIPVTAHLGLAALLLADLVSLYLLSRGELGPARALSPASEPAPAQGHGVLA
jgi:heme A synthase